jgi:SPP1 family predicted phage head-tail adaptor
MNWPMPDPGEYRHQVTLMRQRPTVGISGAEMEWVKFATCYAAIDPASAKDVIRSGQTTSQVATPIRMNWLSGVTSDMQVWANGNKYVIQGIINPQELNVTLILVCVALGANE